MAAGYPPVLRRNLRRALRSGDLTAARQLLERLQEEEPAAPETRILELEVLLAGRHDAEAEALTAQLLELYPESPRVHYLAGRLAYRRKNYPQAVEHLRESDRLHPHWLSRHLLAQALTQLGEFPEAEGILLELLAEHPQVRKDLAWLYERQGLIDRALEQLDRHLNSFPDDAFARDQRLRLRARLAHPETVAEDVAGLLAMGEEVPEELLLVHGEELIAQGRTEELRHLLAEREPLSDRLTHRLGWSCYKAGLDELAWELFSRTFARHTGDFKLLTALEAAARRCGRLKELAVLYASHAPEEPRLWGRLKRVQKWLGETEKGSSEG